VEGKAAVAIMPEICRVPNIGWKMLRAPEFKLVAPGTGKSNCPLLLIKIPAG
jgi:hypothetical protein